MPSCIKYFLPRTILLNLVLRPVVVVASSHVLVFGRDRSTASVDVIFSADDFTLDRSILLSYYKTTSQVTIRDAFGRNS